MDFNIREYGRKLDEHNIDVIYTGPIWAGGIDGLAEMMLKRLEFDNVPFAAAQYVFSVFVEQMNNMLLYSAEKEDKDSPDGESVKISKGIFVFGSRESTYFIQTGNVVTDNSADILRLRIDHLNSLDKDEMRAYYKEQLRTENYNPESRGAGIGLTEVARRASGPVTYEFEPLGDGYQFFTMNITVQLK